ncbi:MAG: diguanylate cyclase [Desulfosporosinus sp. BRH_c37]|nr:MAG: diguanylate cyclase [Desulfosporosinus sp. BRH_c37]
MIEGNTSKDLFFKEIAILEHSMDIVNNEKYRDNELLTEYHQLTKHYNTLLTLTKKAFKISDAQSKNLKMRESEKKNLLDNSNQGFLTFASDLLIDREYSMECNRIFNRAIGNINILELLFPDNEEQNRYCEEVLKAIFVSRDIETRLLYIAKLPSLVEVNHKHIEVKYKMITTGESEKDNNTLMLILSDITEKRKVEDEVIYLSYHDKLTSLYNRAYVESMLPQLQSEASLPLSIIMADMNGLKLTNDVFGHESGDKLLVNVSKVFLSCCRQSDIVARWGGDEFFLILPGASSTVCEKICERVKYLCSKVDPDPIELSVSLGAATSEKLNTNLTSLMTVAESAMYSNKLMESKTNREKIILSLEKSLHQHCFEDIEHIERIKGAVIRFSEVLQVQLDANAIETMILLARFHDVGKAAIPHAILSKAGPLTQDEWNIMRSYTEIGYRMAQSIDEPVLAQAILAFREHWDGQGYPYGLKGEKIPLISRIFSILDAYDVMTNGRPYKDKMSKDEAVEEIKRCSARQFDPNLVTLFLDNLNYLIS